MSNLTEVAKKQIARKAFIALILMVIGSIGIDQVTKYFAEDKLMIWSDTTDLRQYRGQRLLLAEIGQWNPAAEQPQLYVAMSFNYVRNQGAAWGILSDLNDAIRIPFFYLVTLVAVFIIGMYLKATPVNHRLARYALALILSGALGNLIDRMHLGYVIDFIDVRWIIPIPFVETAWRYNFPNFNWADSCISVGVSFLIFDMLFLEPKRKKHETQTAKVLS